MITQERLKQLLSYDPATGAFTWLRAHRKIKVGDRAGALDAGYWRMKIDGQSYKASRLAFLYMTGSWPKADAEHKNLQRHDDSWDNLREATRSQNTGNTEKRKKNACGVKGVYFSKAHNKWRAQCRGKHLGLFSSLEEAGRAYAERAKVEFGEFARA